MDLNVTLLNNTGLSFMEVCELNQYKLIEETAKLPKMLFWISLAIFVGLFIHFWIVPWLRSWKYYAYIQDAFAGFSFALSIFLVLYMFLFTFQLDAQTLKRVGDILLIVFIPLVIIRIGYILYKHRDKIVREV